MFDFCQNLEYFNQPLKPAATTDAAPLGEQIFKARLELIQQLTARGSLAERSEIASVLRGAIASMNGDNFLVRPHIQLVEKYRNVEAWNSISVAELAELAKSVAGLPDQLEPKHEDAKRFDMLLLKAQLSLLAGEPFERQRKKVMQIAGLLEDHEAIPAVAQQLELIQDIQSDLWWVDATYPMLELIRKRLRSLGRKGIDSPPVGGINPPGLQPMPTSPVTAGHALDATVTDEHVPVTEGGWGARYIARLEQQGLI